MLIQSLLLTAGDKFGGGHLPSEVSLSSLINLSGSIK